MAIAPDNTPIPKDLIAKFMETIISGAINFVGRLPKKASKAIAVPPFITIATYSVNAPKSIALLNRSV